MNSLLLDFKKSGALPEVLYYRLRSSAGKTPQFYGLPKVHKPGRLLRPIVTFINSPTYQLSKHFVSLLSPLVINSSFYVVNSFDFATFIKKQLIPQGKALVSLDVVSLFTKVSVERATDIA